MFLRYLILLLIVKPLLLFTMCLLFAWKGWGMLPLMLERKCINFQILRIFNLLNIHSILHNYRPMIAHLEHETDDGDMQNFLWKCKDEDMVRLTAILCDVLFMYQRYQKYIQSDLISVFDLESTCDFYGTKLLKLLNNSLTSGSEDLGHMHGILGPG